MSTTHVCIVNDNTLKYHLRYMFIGTGAKDKNVDFNNTIKTNHKYQSENLLVGMLADLNRIRKGDYVIFYLLQNKEHEGKFFGIFQVEDMPFLDRKGTFLSSVLEKKLTFRCNIRPYEVYSEGVSEWEALDEIKGMQSPNQMLWSLIYRKLKANRGNTMITLYESERLFHLIRCKNKNKSIKNSQGFSFNGKTIIASKSIQYKGRKTQINILPRLIKKYKTHNAFEAHLQAYIVQMIESRKDLKNLIVGNRKIEWIGNEVSCGVGMQRIDIMVSLLEKKNKRFVVPIELKAIPFYDGITKQLQRYIDWLTQYYIPNQYSIIQPMVITKYSSKVNINNFKEELRKFNKVNNMHLPVKWMTFKLNSQKKDLFFQEVKY